MLMETSLSVKSSDLVVEWMSLSKKLAFGERIVVSPGQTYNYGKGDRT